MPGAWAHSQYWAGTNQGPVESPTASRGGYPTWQITTLTSAGFLFGGLQPVFQWVYTVVTQKDKA